MKYGKEVKEQAVLRILNKDATIKQVAEELYVHYTTVRDWVRQYRTKKHESFPGTGHQSASDAEMTKIQLPFQGVRDVPCNAVEQERLLCVF